MGLEDYYIKWPSMMQDLMSCCSNHDVSILYRVLSVIEGMCSKLEMVPDNDIVSSLLHMPSMTLRTRYRMHVQQA